LNGGLYVRAGGLDILKFDKPLLIKCFVFEFGVAKPNKAFRGDGTATHYNPMSQHGSFGFAL